MKARFRSIFTSAMSFVIRWILIISVPVILVVVNIRLVMSPVFLQLEYPRPGFPADPYGFSTEDRLHYGSQGIEYILQNQPLTYLSTLTLPGHLCYPNQEAPCPAFNDLELAHMADVQVVAQSAFLIALLLIGFWISLSILKQLFVRSVSLLLSLMRGSLLTIMLIIVIILLATMAWDLFFTQFHTIFFTENTWQFFYSDTLIRLYPEQFWFDAALLIGILTFCQAFVIVGLVWRSMVVRREVDQNA